MTELILSEIDDCFKFLEYEPIKYTAEVHTI